MNRIISVTEAEKLILDNLTNFGTEVVSIQDSIGRILADDINADRDYPAGNRSTMDGIAIDQKSLSKTDVFEIIGVQPAGMRPLVITKPEQCIQIMTGAILDDSVDTIVKVEDIIITDGTAKIREGAVVQSGQFIHKKAIDAKKGQLVVSAGQAINPKEVAIFASFGMKTVRVSKVPRVLVVTTGDELVQKAGLIEDYQVRLSNDQAIISILGKYGILPDCVHLADDQSDINKYLSSNFNKYDVVITTGGVSMGIYDFVQHSLSQIGAEIIFHGVAQRPGKPLLFARKDKTIFFALPGNPVSTYLCLVRYLVPWLLRSQGQIAISEHQATIDCSKLDESDLTRFVPVRLSQIQGELIAKIVAGNGSGDFISLASADAFAEVPANHVMGSNQLVKVWSII
jgi:molybdopterin molybdotransferase